MVTSKARSPVSVAPTAAQAVVEWKRDSTEGLPQAATRARADADVPIRSPRSARRAPRSMRWGLLRACLRYQRATPINPNTVVALKAPVVTVSSSVSSQRPMHVRSRNTRPCRPRRFTHSATRGSTTFGLQRTAAQRGSAVAARTFDLSVSPHMPEEDMAEKCPDESTDTCQPSPPERLLTSFATSIKDRCRCCRCFFKRPVPLLPWSPSPGDRDPGSWGFEVSEAPSEGAASHPLHQRHQIAGLQDEAHGAAVANCETSRSPKRGSPAGRRSRRMSSAALARQSRINVSHVREFAPPPTRRTCTDSTSGCQAASHQR